MWGKNRRILAELIKEEHTLLLMDGRFVKRMFKRIEINAEGLELG
jgi:hypothetical protein